MKFNVPLHIKDLLNEGGGNYRVRQEYSVRDLKSKLNEVKHALRQRGSDTIIEGSFDVFHSVLTLCQKGLPAEMKHESFEILLQAMNDVIRRIDEFVCSNDTGRSSEKLNHINRLKMTTFLFCQLAQSLETSTLQSEACIIGGGKGKGRSKKKAEEQEGDSWNWEEKRQETVNILFRLVNIHIQAIFEPPIVEEDIVNVIGNYLFSLLENTSIALVRMRDVRLSIFQVLGTLVTKHSYSLSCRLKLVQGLKTFEHLAVPLAEAVEKITVDYESRSFLVEVLKEIDRTEGKEMTQNSGGTKAVSQFLVELAERIPDKMQPCLCILVNYLDGESFMLRKSILGVLGEIVLQSYTSQQLDENAKNSRDLYLDHIELHVHDVNAHVRSQALQVWGKLCQGNAIPLSRQQQVLTLVVGRLQDKSSLVRKQSVQLLTLLLQRNPFDASLCVEDLNMKLSEERAKLDQLVPKDEAHLTTEKWMKVEKVAKKYLKNFSGEEQLENEVCLPDEACDAHEQIRLWLGEMKISPAVNLLIKAKEKFPIFNKLGESDLTIGNDIEMESDSDSSESNSNIDESSNPTALLNQLRKIFFLPLFHETPEDNEQSMSEVTKQRHIVSFFTNAVAFASTFDEALLVVCQLLSSKQASDVTEAINFFVSAFEFGLLNAMVGVRKMLALIFSREPSIQKSVVDAYKRLYINPVMAGNNASALRTNNIQMVKNLMNLVNGANIGDLAGLEELIEMLASSKDIDKNAYQVMWQFFTGVIHEEGLCRRSALILLGMVAAHEPSIIRSNIPVLIEHGLGEEGKEDLRIVHDLCVAILKTFKKKQPVESTPFRLPEDHELFLKLDEIMFDKIIDMNDASYIPMVQQAVSVIYQLSELPDGRMGNLIKRVHIKLEELKIDAQDAQEIILSRFLFLIGHTAVCHLNYLDFAVFSELKRRAQARESKLELAKNAAKKKNIAGSATRKRKSMRDTPAATQASDEVDEVIGAEADDTDAEFVRGVCEKEVVTGSNLLAKYSPMIVEICSSKSSSICSELRTSASLALAKFMLVSGEFCEDNLQLFFTLLEKSRDNSLRANLIIAAGDMSFRFPNTLEPWTPRMYACLRDKSSIVRINTLTVLTHLILNDMIKVKGQIADMAFCITDDEVKISSLAKLFFAELSRKGNSLYNVMPDIISRLSDTNNEIEEERFQEILRYIIELFEKDKHLESLVDKLCQRFRFTKTERQWRDLAFCLSLFPYSDKSLKKLMENFSCYGDKLYEDTVYECFVTILTQGKKTFKQEGRTTLEELLVKIEEQRNKQVEDDTAAKRAVAAANKKQTK